MKVKWNPVTSPEIPNNTWTAILSGNDALRRSSLRLVNTSATIEYEFAYGAEPTGNGLPLGPKGTLEEDFDLGTEDSLWVKQTSGSANTDLRFATGSKY